jgi:hypothetical protein
VAGSGQSFDGAGQYYLHDKRKDQDGLSTDADRLGDYALHDKADRQTAFRVGFTEILNMDAETPAQAIAQMSASYERYKERERNKRGRKLTKPVYAYSLAWAFDQTPDKNEMMAAALSSLKALGLEKLETLIVQHTDEPQPHVHVIVNRIELDGRNARNIYRDHLALSKWAEQYERDHGGILCEQRVVNNEARRRGEFVRDTISLTPSEYAARERLRKAETPRHMTAFEAVENSREVGGRALELAHRHIVERRHFEVQAEARIASDRISARARFAPEWSKLYKLQALQNQILKAANTGGIFERACFVLANRDFLKKGGRLGIREIAKFAFSSQALTKRVERVHTLERADLAAWQVKQTDSVERIARQDYREELVKLRARQQLETDGLNYELRVEFENRRLTQQQARPEVSRPPSGQEPPSQSRSGPEPPLGPQPPAPTLRPGEGLEPSEVGSFLHDAPQLRDEFQKSAEPPAKLSRSQEINKRMEEYRRKNPGRDFGRER